MAEIVGPYEVSRFKNLTFEITETLRNQVVSIPRVKGDFVINVDGLIYKNGGGSGTSATVVIVGGLGNFTNEKDDNRGVLFLSAPQKRTVASIMKSMATRYFNANITSPLYDLEEMLNASYENYKG